MKRRRGLAILLMIVIIAVPLSFGIIYIHDNPVNLIQIYSINSGITQTGANVTVKGNITSIVCLLMLNDQSVSLSDDTGILQFHWAETRLEVGWLVIVKGTVSSNNSLWPVSNVELVMLFP